MERLIDKIPQDERGEDTSDVFTQLGNDADTIIAMSLQFQMNRPGFQMWNSYNRKEDDGWQNINSVARLGAMTIMLEHHRQPTIVKKQPTFMDSLTVNLKESAEYSPDYRAAVASSRGLKMFRDPDSTIVIGAAGSIMYDSGLNNQPFHGGRDLTRSEQYTFARLALGYTTLALACLKGTT